MKTQGDSVESRRRASNAALEGLARTHVCAVCRNHPDVAWIDGEWAHRCACWPDAPELTRPGRSELSRAIRDPDYPTDAVTRMQAERIRERRNHGSE